MFACSGLSLRNIDFELLKFKHDQQKITKNITPGAGEDTGHQAILWGRDCWFSAFVFLIRLLRNVCCVWFTASVLCVWGGNHERGSYV